MKEVRRIKSRKIETILKTPDKDLLSIKPVKIKLPDEAKIYPSVKCDKCGEKVMESRTRLKDGKILCLPCFDALHK